MSFITNHLATQIALQTTQMMLHQSHQRQMEENERRRRQKLEQEEQQTLDATKYTAPEAYIPKHASKEDIEKYYQISA